MQSWKDKSLLRRLAPERSNRRPLWDVHSPSCPSARHKPLLTAGCGDIDPYTPCRCGRLSNPSDGTLCACIMLCGSTSLKPAVSKALRKGDRGYASLLFRHGLRPSFSVWRTVSSLSPRPHLPPPASRPAVASSNTRGPRAGPCTPAPRGASLGCR